MAISSNTINSKPDENIPETETTASLSLLKTQDKPSINQSVTETDKAISERTLQPLNIRDEPSTASCAELHEEKSQNLQQLFLSKYHFDSKILNFFSQINKKEIAFIYGFSDCINLHSKYLIKDLRHKELTSDTSGFITLKSLNSSIGVIVNKCYEALNYGINITSEFRKFYDDIYVKLKHYHVENDDSIPFELKERWRSYLLNHVENLDFVKVMSERVKLLSREEAKTLISEKITKNNMETIGKELMVHCVDLIMNSIYENNSNLTSIFNVNNLFYDSLHESEDKKFIKYHVNKIIGLTLIYFFLKRISKLSLKFLLENNINILYLWMGFNLNKVMSKTVTSRPITYSEVKYIIKNSELFNGKILKAKYSILQNDEHSESFYNVNLDISSNESWVRI